jgi:hypothetical protein
MGRSPSPGAGCRNVAGDVGALEVFACRGFGVVRVVTAVDLNAAVADVAAVDVAALRGWEPDRGFRAWAGGGCWGARVVFAGHVGELRAGPGDAAGDAGNPVVLRELGCSNPIA